MGEELDSPMLPKHPGVGGPTLGGPLTQASSRCRHSEEGVATGPSSCGEDGTSQDIMPEFSSLFCINVESRKRPPVYGFTTARVDIDLMLANI